MQQPTFSLQKWMEHLRHLVPITGIVHVGAGTGREAVQYGDWSVPSALFIEADEQHAEKLSAALQNRNGWVSHIALLSDREGEQDFFVATNPSESGVVQPEKLSRFWRNLQTKEKRSLTTTTLDVLLAAGEETDAKGNYAVIDCLPALPVLQGAKKSIAGWDVIVARVILDETQGTGLGAGKAELDRFLNANGFACLVSEEEKQPAIGWALYVRDWRAALQYCRGEQQARVQQLAQVRDEQTKLLTERQLQIEQLTQARDKQLQLATERQVQIEEVTKEQVALGKQIETLRQQVQQLTQARDEQAKLAADRQSQIQQLTQARDEQRTLATERQIKIDNLSKERNTLSAQLQKANQEKEKATQQQEKIRRDNEEILSRQQMMNDELVRAEAQIDLIKDLLLRDSGL